jgi:hypothetical protein
MAETHELEAGWSTNVASPVGGFRDVTGAIGDRTDTPAVSVSGRQSSTGLLKGLAAGVGLGSGTAIVELTPRLRDDPEAAIGSPEDAAATDISDPQSVPALLKGILAFAGV